MQIREGTGADIPAILESGIIFNPRVGFEHMAVAVEADGSVIGVAKAFRSRLHRTRYWTTVRVKESARLHGVGRELLNALAGMRSEPLPFAYRCRADDPALAFIRSVGGRIYQEIPGLRLDLRDPETQAWIDELPDRDDVISGSELTGDELVNAWCAMYTWTHDDWSPVATVDDVERVFGDEVRTGLFRRQSRFVRRDGTIIAGSFVFETPQHEPLDIVAETISRDVDGTVLAACVRQTLRTAREGDWSEVSFEAHRDDPHVTPLIESAPSVHGTPFMLMEYDPAAINAR